MEKEHAGFPESSVIGLTGGIGSGKSTAGSFLARLESVYYISADKVGRKLLEPGEAGWLALRESFGSKYFRTDQTVDRKLLRSSIFQDSTLRRQVNTMLHPLIREEIWRQIRIEQDRGMRGVFVVEVPLLFGTGWDNDFVAVVVINADREVCIERLTARDGLSREEIEAAMASQWPLGDKVRLADHVIDNSGSLAETFTQLSLLGKNLVSDYGKNA